MSNVHIHVHQHTTRDSGFEESKHPRANNGQFGHGSGGRGAEIDRAQAEHARRTGQALSRGQAAQQVANNQPHARQTLRAAVAQKNALAEKQAERRATALANARGAQKNDAKAKAKAFEALKSHPNYSEADFTYLKEKGYEPDEIRAIWDRDKKAGHGPQLGNKNSKENKHEMQQIGKAMGLFGRK